MNKKRAEPVMVVLVVSVAEAPCGATVRRLRESTMLAVVVIEMMMGYLITAINSLH